MLNILDIVRSLIKSAPKISSDLPDEIEYEMEMDKNEIKSEKDGYVTNEMLNTSKKVHPPIKSAIKRQNFDNVCGHH